MVDDNEPLCGGLERHSDICDIPFGAHVLIDTTGAVVAHRYVPSYCDDRLIDVNRPQYEPTPYGWTHIGNADSFEDIKRYLQRECLRDTRRRNGGGFVQRLGIMAHGANPQLSIFIDSGRFYLGNPNEIIDVNNVNQYRGILIDIKNFISVGGKII